eukprot:3011965-Rhodomonas_salina.3
MSSFLVFHLALQHQTPRSEVENLLQLRGHLSSRLLVHFISDRRDARLEQVLPPPVPDRTRVSTGHQL